MPHESWGAVIVLGMTQTGNDRRAPPTRDLHPCSNRSVRPVHVLPTPPSCAFLSRTPLIEGHAQSHPHAHGCRNVVQTEQAVLIDSTHRLGAKRRLAVERIGRPGKQHLLPVLHESARRRNPNEWVIGPKADEYPLSSPLRHFLQQDIQNVGA